MSTTLPTVAVIGSGTMGAGIAEVAAAAGHPVLIYDIAP
ncbi:TPA: 3-hydroxyacyl-CoA dehydrogenase NAD-binding domain-containing protein, partial [Klebsiella michiganensis]